MSFNVNKSHDLNHEKGCQKCQKRAVPLAVSGLFLSARHKSSPEMPILTGTHAAAASGYQRSRVASKSF